MSHLAHPDQINKHIWEELWLYYKIDNERKKHIISFFLNSLILIFKTVMENRFFNFVNVFSLFAFEKDVTLHWNKFEFPSPKNALCQVWLNVAQWFSRRRFSNFLHIFFLIPNYLPLEKGRALHLNKFKFTYPKDTLCQVWLKFTQCFLGRMSKMWKESRRTDRSRTGDPESSRWAFR